MLSSSPPVFCLTAYEGDVEPYISNCKSPRGTLEAHPSCFLRTVGTQEDVCSVSCTPHECRQARIRCHTPPYFSNNPCNTHCSNIRVLESHQQQLVHVRAASEDRQVSHTCHEGPCTEAQQRMPCIFVKTNHETEISSHPSTTHFQDSSLCQAPVVSVRNSLDYANAPCRCYDGQQNSLQCHHAPCFHIRSPTGDHRIPTRVVERIQAFYPSPPPPPPLPPPPSSSNSHLVDQRDQREGHHQCGMGHHLCWTRLLPEPVSNIKSSSEPMLVHLQHQPPLTSFMTSPALTPNELHQFDCPLKAAHQSVSYLWVKSSSNEQQEHLPGPESYRRYEQEKPPYIWMRNTSRARSEIHAGMVRPSMVTQCQPHVRNSSDGHKYCSHPDGQTSALEHLPTFILISNKPEVTPCAESIGVPGRSSSPIAFHNITWNNKPSSSAESLHSVYQKQSPPTSPKDLHQFIPSAEGKMEQPTCNSRNHFPDDPIKTSSVMQDFHVAHPSIYLLIQNPGKVPMTQLPQDETKTTTESSRTVNMKHLPFGSSFSEGETYCKLESLGTVMQEPAPCKGLLEKKRSKASPSVDDIPLLFPAPKKMEMGKNPHPISLLPTAEWHQKPCLVSDQMDEYLHQTIPRSHVPHTLIQSHLPFPLGEVPFEHQNEVYCMLYSSWSMCEQQLTASVLTSNPEPQHEHVRCAAGQKLKQEAPAPISSPVSRASSSLQIPQCSLLDASGNKNNSSPRTPSPGMEEDQASYLMVQNILQNCESRTISPSLREAAHGQPPQTIIGPTPEGQKTANSDPHASGVHHTPRTIMRTGPADQNLIYASCSSSQSCLTDQPPASSEQIPPEFISVANSNPDVHFLEKTQTNNVDYNGQAGEPSCCEHFGSQTCRTDQALVQSIPKELEEANSSAERSSTCTNLQQSVPGSQIIPKDQNKPICSSGAMPCVVPIRPSLAGDDELTSGHVLTSAVSHSSPFMYFQILRLNRHSMHQSPNRLHDQGDLCPCHLPVPGGSTGSHDVASQSRKIVQLSYRKASIRRVIVQCQTPQPSLGTVSEQESELGKSSDGRWWNDECTGVQQRLHLDKLGAVSAHHTKWDAQFHPVTV